jgi:hypothetical protein
MITFSDEKITFCKSKLLAFYKKMRKMFPGSTSPLSSPPSGFNHMQSKQPNSSKQSSASKKLS